jgi:cell division protein FtsW (lipid II flippase)
VLGLLLAAHLATRRLAPRADPLLLPIAALLNGVGYVFIVRLSDDLGPGSKRLPGLQATWTMLGVVAFVVTLIVVRRVRELDRYRYTLALIGVALLLSPLVPGLGASVNGSRIWLRFAGFSIQPGEFAKIALAVFFASYLVDKRELLRSATYRLGPLPLPEPRHLAPVLAAWGASLVILVLEKDLGSSLLFFTVFVVLVWIATERVAYLLVGAALFALGAYISYRTFGHVQTRIENWLDPWQDPRGRGYQAIQAQFAFAGGGLTGAGPGSGRPTLIPEVVTDYQFAAIGEELGLLGSSAIVVSYLLLAGSGLRVARRAAQPFEKLLATGLTALLSVQAFIIMGGVTRLIPLTGITLPFISYGGSSLLANYVLLALLMRVSDETARHEETVSADVATMVPVT